MTTHSMTFALISIFFSFFFELISQWKKKNYKKKKSKLLRSVTKKKKKTNAYKYLWNDKEDSQHFYPSNSVDTKDNLFLVAQGNALLTVRATLRHPQLLNWGSCCCCCCCFYCYFFILLNVNIFNRAYYLLCPAQFAIIFLYLTDSLSILYLLLKQCFLIYEKNSGVCLFL